MNKYSKYTLPFETPHFARIEAIKFLSDIKNHNRYDSNEDIVNDWIYRINLNCGYKNTRSRCIRLFAYTLNLHKFIIDEIIDILEKKQLN